MHERYYAKRAGVDCLARQGLPRVHTPLLGQHGTKLAQDTHIAATRRAHAYARNRETIARVGGPSESHTETAC